MYVLLCGLSWCSWWPWWFLLFPGAINGLAHEKRGIRASAWLVLLRAAGVDFRRVEVPFLIDAEAVHAPHAAGEIAPRAPRVEEVAVEIVFEHLRRPAIGGPQIPIGCDDEQVDIRRRRTEAPLPKILPVLVEDLHAMVLPIVDEHLACLR